ncbi:hypothetical protein [Paenibacillus sp. UMB4589-SE434]|uniref:hypothetical protein n=1 Tax=Paenibacillus sp. UMB4589-SE434 TaxID=3046314 RepID=UPI002549D19C|nr:hypothetical protein [Paenibacillus sp. UMB4589-SE434]MDK8183265.1 hypothetical protein [Paenibacillus sp. UMB4589-SE434]
MVQSIRDGNESMGARMVKCNSIGVYEHALTRGNSYEVVDEDAEKYRIVGDQGRRVWIPASYFSREDEMILMMEEWQFDDDTDTEYFIEVTIMFKDGSKRWCLLTTSEKLIEYFNNEIIDPPGINIKHLVIMKSMEKEAVEKTLRHLDNQGELQEVTIFLSKS